MKLLRNNSWNDFFSIEFEKKYFNILVNKIDNYSNQIYPTQEDIFKIFRLIDVEQIKVVIMGQDPYHNYQQANGIAFGVNIGVNPPPSLKNIAKEIYKEYNQQLIDYSLESWVKQGVFLINSIWTVFKNNPLSCKDWGWEEFSQNLLKYICKKNNKVVFVCFGNWAYKYVSSINLKNIIILKTSHPSPYSANKGFIGSNIFKKINLELTKLNLKTIQWC